MLKRCSLGEREGLAQRCSPSGTASWLSTASPSLLQPRKSDPVTKLMQALAVISAKRKMSSVYRLLHNNGGPLPRFGNGMPSGVADHLGVGGE